MSAFGYPILHRWRRSGVAMLGLFMASSAAFAQPIFAQTGAKALLDEASAAATAGRYVDALAAYAGAIEAAPGDAAGYVQRDNQSIRRNNQISCGFA